MKFGKPIKCKQLFWLYVMLTAKLVTMSLECLLATDFTSVEINAHVLAALSSVFKALMQSRLFVGHVIFYGNPVLRINRTAPRVAQVLCTVSFRPKPYWPRTPRPKLFLLGLLGTAFSGNNFGFGTSIEVKRITTIYYCQRVLHSKGLRGSFKIARNGKESHNQTKI